MNPQLHNNYGVLLMQARRPGDAAEQFTAAIDADPDFFAAYDGLGYALEAEGKTGEAAEMYRKALALKPDFQAAQQHLRKVEAAVR